MIWKSIIVIASVLFSMPAMGAEWDIAVTNDFVIAAITGNITHGDRQRFVFKKGNCKVVQHIFSIYTTQPANFKKLEDAVLIIEFNGELIGAELLSSKKAMGGHLLMFNLGTYDKDKILNYLKTNEIISIRFVDGNGYKAADYFDMPHNEWSTSGISEAFDNAYRACALADENSSANRLVVEAVKLLNRAQKEQDPRRQLELATEAEEKLNKLIELYPGSDAAVKLATGQSIGTLSLEHVVSEKARYELAISAPAKRAIREASRARREASRAKIEASRARELKVCFAAPTRRCLWAQALGMAEDIGGAFSRVSALTEIAAVQVEAGLVEEARETAGAALATAKGMGKSKSFLLGPIAVVQAKAGDVKGALVTATEMGDIFLSSPLINIVAAQAEAGDVKGALATANGISDTSDRAFALALIAGAQAKAGNVKAALAMAKEISDAYARVVALADIAVAQAKAGDVKDAREIIWATLATAEGISSTFGRAYALRVIATAQAKAGDVKEALVTANRISNTSARAYALREIATAQAEAGDVIEALATANGISDTSSRGWTLRDIAAAQAKAGDVKEAWVTAKEISDTDVRAYALREIAAAQAKAGNVKEAWATAKEISNTGLRASALARIAANFHE